MHIWITNRFKKLNVITIDHTSRFAKMHHLFNVADVEKLLFCFGREDKLATRIQWGSKEFAILIFLCFRPFLN